MHLVAITFSAFLIILGIPSIALAWGPATHLELGTSLLSALPLLPPAVRSLLKRYPDDFLYGNISADIVVAKNMTEELKHCHNWSFGFKLLKLADSDSKRSFAYGYLSHLAADTVAHNNFIPEMMVRSFSSRIHRHIYWEMRFDTLADKDVWHLPKRMEKKVHRDNDLLLSKTLEGTLLSFPTNKTIFQGVINLHRIKHWHKMLSLLSSRSKWALHNKDKERFFARTKEAMIDLLQNEKKAHCIKHDPKGKENLLRAKRERTRLKSIKKKGGHWETPLKRIIKSFSKK
jgi:hypothetical protein